MADMGDLPEAIAALRADLETAMAEGNDRPLQFELGVVELTLQVEAVRRAGGKIGWSLLGVEGSRDVTNTHTVTLTLQPASRTPGGAASMNGSTASGRPLPMPGSR